MENLMYGLDFDEYISKLSDEHRSQMIKSYEKITLSVESKTFFTNFPDVINVVIFSEGYCPDCTAVVPFMRKIQELNSKVILSILSREENVNLLEKCSGAARIPTIMTFEKDMKPMGLYSEFPLELKNNLRDLNDESRAELIKQFREGKFNDMIEKDIMGLFIGKE